MPVLTSFFTLHNISFFNCAILCFFLSLWLHSKQAKWSVMFLFLCALLLRLFMATQDPFLHEWDEQFHTLVARNLMDDPFTPMLMKQEVRKMPPAFWCEGHIWLHKQPLFMWLMALSMKIFGVSVFAARYPSVLMGALMVLMLYDITIQLTRRNDIAWTAATLFCFSNFQLLQISGTIGMDHNDVAFCFFILASFWAYARYTSQPTASWKYAVLIGVLAGCAVLNKWLTGILVYAGWGVNILLKPAEMRKGAWAHLGISLAIATATFMPWQLYIHYRFPEHAAYEAAYNNRHLWEAVEGHTGSNFFYLERFPEYYGEAGWFLVPAGFIILLLHLRKKRIANKPMGTAVIVCFFIVYTFFSYVAATKVIGYFFIVAPLGMLFVAMAMHETQAQLQQTGKPRLARIILPILLTVCIISIFNPERILSKHNPESPNRITQINNVAVYKNLHKHIPRGVSILVNANRHEHILAMFYNTGVRVYEHLPYREVWDSLMQHNTPVVAFASRPGYELPDSIMNRSNVTILYTALK